MENFDYIKGGLFTGTIISIIILIYSSIRYSQVKTQDKGGLYTEEALGKVVSVLASECSTVFEYEVSGTGYSEILTTNYIAPSPNLSVRNRYLQIIYYNPKDPTDISLVKDNLRTVMVDATFRQTCPQYTLKIQYPYLSKPGDTPKDTYANLVSDKSYERDSTFLIYYNLGKPSDISFTKTGLNISDKKKLSTYSYMLVFSVIAIIGFVTGEYFYFKKATETPTLPPASILPPVSNNTPPPTLQR
jgi:hypothetical protein